MAEALALLPCGSTAVLLAEIGKGWILANLSVSTEKELKITLWFWHFHLSPRSVTENLCLWWPHLGIKMSSFHLLLGTQPHHFAVLFGKEDQDLRVFFFFSICSVYRHSFSFFYGGRKEVHVCSGSPHTLCHWNAPVCIMGYGRFWAEHGTKLEMMAKF